MGCAQSSAARFGLVWSALGGQSARVADGSSWMTGLESIRL